MTPFLTARAAMTSLVIFAVVYTFIFSFGAYYIHWLIRTGPAGSLIKSPQGAVPSRPMSLADGSPASEPSPLVAGE